MKLFKEGATQKVKPNSTHPRTVPMAEEGGSAAGGGAMLAGQMGLATDGRAMPAGQMGLPTGGGQCWRGKWV